MDLRKSDYVDKNDKFIYEGAIIKYNGYEYLVIYLEKEEIDWLAHPVGNNPNQDDIPLKDLSRFDIEMVED